MENNNNSQTNSNSISNNNLDNKNSIFNIEDGDIQREKNNSNSNNEVSSKNKNKENLKNRIPLKKIVIISASILLVIIILIIIIVVVTKKNNHKKKVSKIDEKDEDNDQIKIEYEEAEKLIGSEIIKENHKLLAESSSNIKELLLIYDNISLIKVNVTVDDKYKTLDFLIGSNESWIEVAKDDLELYNSRYMILSEQVNDLINESSTSFKNLSLSLNELQKNIENMTEQFEKNIQTLSIPFLLNSNKTNRNLEDNIEEENELIKYKNDIEKLNDAYNINFIKLNNCSKDLLFTYKNIYSNEKFLAKITSDNILIFNLVTQNMTNLTVHEDLKLFKKSFTNTQNEVKNFNSDLEEQKIGIGKFLENAFTDATSNIINILTNINDFDEKFRQEHNQIMPPIFTLPHPTELIDNIIHFSLWSIDNIKAKLKSFNEMDDIEISTSLDLLLILDLTGSMRDYVEEAKRSLISIINGIILNCPGIDINLGFIGYRDFYEQYTNIDFTKDHTYVKNIISNVQATGGGFYIPEDVALALDLALKKIGKVKPGLLFLLLMHLIMEYNMEVKINILSLKED